MTSEPEEIEGDEPPVVTDEHSSTRAHLADRVDGLAGNDQLPVVQEERPPASDAGSSVAEVVMLPPPSPPPSVLSTKRMLGVAQWEFDHTKSPRLDEAVSWPSLRCVGLYSRGIIRLQTSAKPLELKVNKKKRVSTFRRMQEEADRLNDSKSPSGCSPGESPVATEPTSSSRAHSRISTSPLPSPSPRHLTPAREDLAGASRYSPPPHAGASTTPRHSPPPRAGASTAASHSPLSHSEHHQEHVAEAPHSAPLAAPVSQHITSQQSSSEVSVQ